MKKIINVKIKGNRKKGCSEINAEDIKREI